MIHRVGIDVRTSDAIKIIRRLEKLKGTVSIAGPFPYYQCPTEAKLHYEGTMDEATLDAWLYRTKHGADYTGTYSMGCDHES